MNNFDVFNFHYLLKSSISHNFGINAISKNDLFTGFLQNEVATKGQIFKWSNFQLLKIGPFYIGPFEN